MIGFRQALVAFAVVLSTAPSPSAAAGAERTTVATAAAVAGPAQLDAFTWLAGGVWVCDGSALPGALSRIETRYDVAPNGRVLRFTTRFVNKDETVGNGYAGDLFYDPQQRTLRLWYIDSQNEIIQGPVTLDGERWSMTFRSDGAIVGRPGAVDFRVDVLRQTNDLYGWSLSAKAGDAWKPVFKLSYHRVPDHG